MGGSLIKVDIGHGRGWLAPAPAASLRRIDAQLGRPADINEAGRSPEQANENRRKWLAYERYLNGGPWAPKAPYALGADQSVHCWGGAADTDDSYDPHAARVWLDNGWVQTALYPNNLAKHEPWHREYFAHLDKHRFDPAPAGQQSAPEPESEEDDDMPKNSGFIYRGTTQGTDQRTVLICNYGSGLFHEYTNGITAADSKYNADIAKAFDTTSFAEISASHAASIKKSLAS